MEGILTVLDFETTSTQNPYAIEIGLIALDENLEEVARYESVIKPPIQVSKEILGFTRLTANQIETAPSFEDIWPDLHKYLSERVVVAHFAEFENKVLYKEFLRLGIEEFIPTSLCSLKMTKEIFPRLGKYSLEFLTDHFGISHDSSHQAISDVISTVDLLKKLNNHSDLLQIRIEQLRSRLVSIPTPQDRALPAQPRVRSKAENHEASAILDLLASTGKSRISITGTPSNGKDAMERDFESVGLTYDKGPVVNAMAFVVRCSIKPGESKIMAAKTKGIPVISEDLANEIINKLRNR